MGFKDYLRVAAAAASDAVRELDKKLDEDQDYAAVRASVAKKAGEAKLVVQSKLEEAGGTEKGQRVGETARKFSAVIAKAPVLSAIGDTLSEHAGIPELLRLRADSPDDPWPLVWLSEGLQRLHHNRTVFLAVRAPFEPLSAMIAIGARTTGSLGAENPVERCQRAAWSLAMRTLRRDPHSLKDVHVLARIYLARNFPKQAVALAARCAIAC